MKPHTFNHKSDHGDLRLLNRTLIDLGFKIESTWTDPLLPAIRSASCDGVEMNYLRVHNLHHWSDKQIELLKVAIAATNDGATTFTFKLEHTDDFEMDIDDDRSWPASFVFSTTVNGRNMSK